MTAVVIASSSVALAAIGLVLYLSHKMASVYHERSVAVMEADDARAQLKLLDAERVTLNEALKRKEAEVVAVQSIRKRIEKERDAAVQKLVLARPGASVAGINDELRRIADLGKTPPPAPLPVNPRAGAVHGSATGPGLPGRPGDPGPGRK